MNCFFYEAIDRLPLATVAAIEFLGVIVVAAVGLRSARNLLALVLAAAGVYVLTGVRFAGAPLGVAFALANAALFALYIVIGHRVSRRAAWAASTASRRPCWWPRSSSRRSPAGPRPRCSATPSRWRPGSASGSPPR